MVKLIADMEHPHTRKLRQQLLEGFMGFCLVHSKKRADCGGATLAYMKYLYKKNLVYRTIMNYVSFLKQSMKRLRVPCELWDCENIKLMVKAVSKTPTSSVCSRAVLSVKEVDVLFRINARLPHPVPYAVAFSLGLFAFLRISNLVPSTASKFNPQKQISVGDVELHSNGAAITLRWAKNLQKFDKTHVVRVPWLVTRPHMCPCRALVETIKYTGGKAKISFVNIGGAPLTERMVRQRLANILRLMGLTSRSFTFHGLRRTGATMEIRQQVPLAVIKAHGAWASDVVWCYIKNSQTVSAQVPTVLSMLFK